MLVRVKEGPRKLNDGHLAVLAGNRVICSDFGFSKFTEIFGEGEPAEHVYQITSGAVRTYKLLSDGRRQINAFHLPGDIFGIENGDVHRFTAEAVTDTTVRCARRRSLLDGIEQRVPDFTSNLLGLVTRNLQHAENHMLLLGRKTSVERVAAFLIEMDERKATPDILTLPMTRHDIADYLGLTLETVSRALSKLRDQRLIRFKCSTGRELVLIDRAALRAIAG